MSEQYLIKQILLAASARGARLFRNQVGFGWYGTVRHVGSEVRITNARVLKAGLCVGSSDILGWLDDGRFAALEVKTGRVPVTTEQRDFIAAVKKAGGVAGVVRSVEDAMRLMEERR